MFLPESYFQKFVEAGGDVIDEPVLVEDGDDIVRIREKARLGNLLQLIFDGFTLIGEDQARFVQGVAPKHAANCVGEELLHGVGSH